MDYIALFKNENGAFDYTLKDVKLSRSYGKSKTVSEEFWVGIQVCSIV